MRVQCLRPVVVPLAQSRVITTVTWDVVAPHCHVLTRRIRRCSPDGVEHVQSCELFHERLICVRIMLSHITHSNFKCCASLLICALLI